MHPLVRGIVSVQERDSHIVEGCGVHVYNEQPRLKPTESKLKPKKNNLIYLIETTWRKKKGRHPGKDIGKAVQRADQARRGFRERRREVRHRPPADDVRPGGGVRCAGARTVWFWLCMISGGKCSLLLLLFVLLFSWLV